jgi:hypothetical protein
MYLDYEPPPFDLVEMLKRCERNCQLGLKDIPFLTSDQGRQILLLLKKYKPIMLNKPYDPNFGDDRPCECGHPYHRHFDGYEDNAPVGCKYCVCMEFKEAPSAETPPKG